MGKSGYQIEELYVPIKNDLFILHRQILLPKDTSFCVWYLKYRLYFDFLVQAPTSNTRVTGTVDKLWVPLNRNSKKEEQMLILALLNSYMDFMNIFGMFTSKLIQLQVCYNSLKELILSKYFT